MKSREIKFRVWDNHFQKWITQGVTISLDGTIKEVSLGEIMGEEHNCILQQYTGLKDKHCKNICEGDFVKSLYRDATPDGRISEEWSEPREVIWSNMDIGFRLGKYHLSLSTNANNIEIVGNIFENPELLDYKK